MRKPFSDSSDAPDFLAAAPIADSSASMGAPRGPAPSMLGAPINVPDEAQEAAAAVAASGTGAAGSMVSVGSSAGLTINLVFDNAAMAAPQSFRDGITKAMQMICAAVTDKITLNLQIDYSGTGGGAAGGPSGGNYVNYSTVRADLVNNASPGDPTFNSLPTGSTIAGQSQVAVWYSQEKLWGLISPTGTEIDGSATFATDINPSLLVGVALHELTHAMGRVPYAGNSGQPDIFDFYRFTSPGNNLVNGNSTAPAAYFSLNGGATKIADYGQTSDPSDFLNNGVQGSADPFNEFYSNGTQQQLTPIDLKELDALGFHLLSNTPQTVIEAQGSTELVQVGNNYFLDPVAGSTGPELIYGGAPLTVGQFAWTPIGAEVTATGYEVALKNVAAGLYTIWNTDSSGNVLSASLSGVSGSNPALEALETSFHQDLNGDGIIGPVSTAIEAFGSTSLVQAGNVYFLNSNSTGSGPEVMFGGAPLTVGEFAWTPIGAEVTSTGYEIALKNAASGQYTEWLTDASGNVLYDPIGNVSGTSATLESLETSFHQDLNGDGTIGIAGTVIEAFGSTSLVQTSNDYYLNSASTGSGPEIMFGGAPLTVGEFAWTPIGAEVTSTGYEIALKNAASGQYTEWLADANGNVLYDPIGNVSGTSPTLESLETSFHQDLNGDGTIGIAGTVIEAFGSTSLVQASNNYFLTSNGTGSGPEVMYGSAPLTAGQFAWTPIGAEVTSTGYEIALKNAATGQYTEWLADANGNVLYDPIGNVSGTSTTLESLESSFHQDLNGDGTVGIPAPAVPAAQVANSAPAAQVASAMLVTPAFSTSAGDTFAFRHDLGSIGGNSSPPAAPQQFSPLLESAIEHVTAELQHVATVDLSDLIGARDSTAHGALFDLLHDFMLH